ncbi:MAG: alkaline phosphatase family protein [Bdellovibrionales bacterium]
MSIRFVKQVLTIIVGSVVFGISFSLIAKRHQVERREEAHPWRLYWFVPDGLRADPDVFKLFEWAEKGELPNIRAMMREGSYGYSIPVFPSHTPVNFATLFTGTKPNRHGVADGPIRLRGYPLQIIPRTGFSSIAKMIDPFWYTLEKAGLVVTLLSVPGSTPPEITRGHVIKGRWGGWGFEFPAMIFHSREDHAFRRLLGWNDKVFQVEKPLTQFVDPLPPEGWDLDRFPSEQTPVEVNLTNWEAPLYGLLLDSITDGKETYDTLLVSRDRKEVLFTLKVGDWSDWFPIQLEYRVQKNYQEALPQKLEIEQQLATLKFQSQARLRVIRLGPRGQFRIRILYNGLNESLTVPPDLASKLKEAAGPMVDFVDNFPPQLIYFDEDKKVFQEEMQMSFDWHANAQRYLLDHLPQDVFVQTVYSPNQMLTSRWWMGHLDPRGADYPTTPDKEKKQLTSEVLAMYKRIDEMLGEALRRRREDSYVILSSDHGAVPLNQEVRLNNLFARKGWLNFTKEKATGILRIDWSRTKVVFLNMNHIYLKPEGLGGNYQPSVGSAYENLRQEVIRELESLRSTNGQSPLAAWHTREQAAEWGLPEDRVGDILIAANTGYGWIEDVTEDQEVFHRAIKSGYKQSVLADREPGLWTPFIVVGPGVRKGYKISRPISHLEQYPTVMKLLKLESPYRPDAGPLEEIFSLEH